jgi:L-ascorbate metabolism protein UlaG (beta-lactamase superfamily)
MNDVLANSGFDRRCVPGLCRLGRMNKGGTSEPFPGVKITMVHAEHSSEMILKDADGKDTSYPAGEPGGYLIELENGFKIWHTGDTGVFGDMKLIGERFKPTCSWCRSAATM